MCLLMLWLWDITYKPLIDGLSQSKKAIPIMYCRFDAQVLSQELKSAGLDPKLFQMQLCTLQASRVGVFI